VTGPERFAVLIGRAGTGKGVVIDAAACAEQHAGRDTLGVAIAGATAERLGLDAPALTGRTLTLDALIARAENGPEQPPFSRLRRSLATSRNTPQIGGFSREMAPQSRAGDRGIEPRARVLETRRMQPESGSVEPNWV
jgi:hypothetical protein